MCSTDHGSHKRVNIQAVDDLVLVHVRFLLIRTAEQHFDKRVDIESVDVAV